MTTLYTFGLLLSLIILPSATMERIQDNDHNEHMETISVYAAARYKGVINENLLSVARAATPNGLLNKANNYYYGQPADQKTVRAYFFKPILNLKKVGAYIQLLRETSIQVREQIPLEEREEAPIDARIWNKTGLEWPIVSVMYDLQAMSNALTHFSDWINLFIYPKHITNPGIQILLQRLKHDKSDTARAIDICKNYKEYQMQKHVSFNSTGQ